ncbi:TonB-dependent siderophore receptor [Polaribacter sp. Hel_I_88]|uniref:TonB-dependent receptor plug domain-containing protein n=1 Tax=Polaribacter sp. Hel_I_88 TaxID=1250006 RepID=UPI0004797482|nr:TonB-dependent receptor [Polaribacter sp. Hel_I_88]
MITNKICFLFLLFFTIQSLVAQQEKEVAKDSTKVEALEEVIISATRTIRQLSSLPLPAQIISKKEIKAVNSIRLSDILNEQTGLITVPDFGGGEGIQLQGLDSQYTLILIDGVPLVGRSAGTLDLNRVSVGNIKQIEIIKGASSSLYGNEALGGVINIITEDPKNGFNGNANYRGGSFGTHDIITNLNYKKNKFGINAFVNRFSSDGYDLVENDAVNTVEPFSNYTLNSKITYDFSENTKLLLSGRFYHQNQDNVASETLKGESEIKEWNTLAKLDHTFNEKWSSYLEFYATQYKAEEFLNDEIGNSFSRSDFNQLFVRPELRTTYQLNEKNAFIGGVGLTHERLKRTDFFGAPVFNSPYIYAQYDGNPTEKINIILGARFDDHSEYHSQFSPKGAIRYKLNDKIVIKSSVGYGFKTPDFRQLYFDFTNATVGYTVLGYNAVSTRIPQLEADGQLLSIVVPVSEFNDNLKPESSIGYNFGIDVNPISNLKLNINLFRNNIENLIDTRVIARRTNGQNVFSYFNVNRVYTQGLEFNANYKLSENITILGGYQLLYAKDKEVEQDFENGEVFARITPSSPSFRLQKDDYFGLFNRSRHMANFKIFYTIPKWNLDINLRSTYRSKFGLFDTNGNTYLDKYDDFVNGYTIWDFAVNKTIYKSYKVGIGMDNILGFNDPQNISNIAGRIIYGTININF